jgi:predicted O-linked N-acetylglucosamine transferase (SPINDLY family)
LATSCWEIAEHVPARRDLGLPEEAFVFCCFNNCNKIQPAFFDLWMRLLGKVSGSVLWFSSYIPSAQVNLQREAQARGVDPERLIFAPKLPLPEHLARYRQADLFLDTLPRNATTTAADCLWAGLPVLTCIGNTYHARACASLLYAVGVPELVAPNPDDYEAEALRLATHPAELAALRTKLMNNRTTYPLFDSRRFRQHIELAYVRMWEIWQRGEAPQSFAIDAVDTLEELVIRNSL